MKALRLALLTAAVGLVVAAAPARAGLTLVSGPDQGTFATNNFGFTGAGSAVNPTGLYWDGPVVGSETFRAHNAGFAPVAILFVFGANGAVSTYADSTAGAYDNVEDTQIGVLNMSGATLSSFKLNGPGGGSGFIAFDGDGISNPNNATSMSTAHGAGAPSNASDLSSGIYGGPMTFFSLTQGGPSFTSSTASSVFVNLIGGLANGSSTYFSLEGDPNALSGIGVVPNPPVPEPASLTLLGVGAVSLVGYAWRRRKALKA
jgi:hypothetical protein